MMSAEDAQKFESELVWCLEQLHLSMQTRTLNEKQALEVSRNIRLLESQKTAYIKKRQLMRILFGDYRKKMENEEKKFKLTPSVCQLQDSKKSKFLRKKRTTVSSLDSTLQPDAKDTEPFRFNFNV